MLNYFKQQKNSKMDSSSRMMMLDGATPNVDPKVCSNSEMLIQSELSNLESVRSIKQENKKNNQYSVKFEVSIQQSKQEHKIPLSHFNNETQDDRLKQVLIKQKLIKFRDNLLQAANILTRGMFEEKKELLNYLFLDYSKEAKQSKKQSRTNKLEKLLFFDVFLPQEKFVIYWNLFSILFSLFTLWLSPFINSFQLSTTPEISHLIEIIFIFQFADGLITCNKAILVQGELIIRRKEIIRRFLKHQIFGDFLNFIIWTITYIGVNQYKISEIFSIIQVVLIIRSIYTKVNSFLDCLYLNGSLSEILDLVFLIISLSNFIHIIACLWHYIALIGNEIHLTNWMEKYGLENQDYWAKYDYSIYWATMTMVTVGYGDITAANVLEIAFSNFTMFVSSFVFAYSMNSIGMIIKNLYDAKSMYKRQLISINNYMKNNIVDVSIQNRVRNYLKNQVDQESQSNQAEAQQIIKNLPDGLRNDINSNIKTRIMKNVKMLINNFSSSTLAQAISLFEQVNFIPNDIIYQPEDRNKDSYLFYMVQGSASLIEIRTQKVIQLYQEKESFGEFSFLCGQDSKFMVVASQFSQLYRISRNEFQKVLQSNQKDKELFHQMKDQLLYSFDASQLGKKCNICSKLDHFNSNCFMISYKPDIEKLVKRWEFIKQPRKLVLRSTKLRANTINLIKVLQSYL